MDSSVPPEHRPATPGAEQTSSILYERRIALFTLVAALPGVVAATILIWLSPWSLSLRLLVMFALWGVSAFLVRLLRNQIVRPLHTLSNVIAALREEDFSFRARGATANDALGHLALEINTLAELLAAQNTRTIEATALLRRVMEAVDVPMFAFDPEGNLRLVNSAGERLLNKPAAALLGRTGAELGIGELMSAGNEAQIVLPQTPDRHWFVRRSRFRQNGVPHTLLVLADVSRVIREEERSAWQRLIRVLGHELNNSLAPIKSIAGTLAGRVSELPIGDEEQQDFRRGLGIIEARAASLNRFLQAYRRLAQMPRPWLGMVDLRSLVERVAALEPRVRVEVQGGPALQVQMDADQIEQMLINLIKNAAEAALEGNAGKRDEAKVTVAWSASDSHLALRITDNGPGLMNADNAFVPFYTTKQEGTGIGLVLSRQIAEAHQGSIRLGNREGGGGCVATVVLPLYHGEASASEHQLSKSNMPA
jgi:two-component system, NtrC family, nitrogen regulation sensor histidine kinase NtrY